MNKELKSTLIFIALFIIVALFASLYAYLVYAGSEGTKISLPSSRVNYTYLNNKTFLINVSFTNVTDITNPIIPNSVCYISTNSANSSWTNITGIVNSSSYTNDSGAAAARAFWVTVNITQISDRKDASINCSASNASTISFMNATNMSTGIMIDSTPPNVSWTALVSKGNYSEATGNGLLKLNVSARDDLAGVNDAAIVFFVYNSSTVNASYTGTREASADNYSISINTSHFPDGFYNISVHVNDSLRNRNETVNLTNVAFDNTAPSLTYTCSPTTVSEGETITCTCSASDATTGVSGTSSCTTSPSTALTGTHSLEYSASDYASNSQKITVSYTVTGVGSGGGAGGAGGGAAVATLSKVQSWTDISPETEGVMKNFAVAYGVKEITIKVKEKAENVKVTVTKYDGKPEAVEAKSGKVYKYLQITAENLEEKLEKGKITVRVEKSWVEDNKLDKDKIAVFKYDEKWKELSTTFIEADADNYYYEAETESFSYFAVGEKEEKPAAEKAKEVAKETLGKVREKAKTMWWVIVVIAVIIAAVIAYVIYKRRY